MLSQAEVLDAALGLVARRGIDVLSLRAVSAQLEVTPMALYRHVGSAAELEHDVLGRIAEGLPAVDASLAWSDACRAWAAGARAVLARYPGAARHLLIRWFDVPPMLDRVEALLQAALADGKRGFAAVAATNAVLMYVLMRVEAETAVRGAAAVKRVLKRVTRQPERYSALLDHIGHYEVARFDEHFEYGLDVLLMGMERHRDGHP